MMLFTLLSLILITMQYIFLNVQSEKLGLRRDWSIVQGCVQSRSSGHAFSIARREESVAVLHSLIEQASKVGQCMTGVMVLVCLSLPLYICLSVCLSVYLFV
jgi:hypothetical protein